MSFGVSDAVGCHVVTNQGSGAQELQTASLPATAHHSRGHARAVPSHSATISILPAISVLVTPSLPSPPSVPVPIFIFNKQLSFTNTNAAENVSYGDMGSELHGLIRF